MGATCKSCWKPVTRATPNKRRSNVAPDSMRRAPPETRFFCATSARPVVKVIPGKSVIAPASTTTSTDASRHTNVASHAQSAAKSPPRKSVRSLCSCRRARMTRLPPMTAPTIDATSTSTTLPRKNTAADPDDSVAAAQTSGPDQWFFFPSTCLMRTRASSTVARLSATSLKIRSTSMSRSRSTPRSERRFMRWTSGAPTSYFCGVMRRKSPVGSANDSAW